MSGIQPATVLTQFPRTTKLETDDDARLKSAGSLYALLLRRAPLRLSRLVKLNLYEVREQAA